MDKLLVLCKIHNLKLRQSGPNKPHFPSSV